jgi:hypothetical protein
LFDLEKDPGEFHNVAGRYPEVAAECSKQLLSRFRSTHPEAAAEPGGLDPAAATEWYLRPRDA